MKKQEVVERMQCKTPQQRFVQMLEEEFGYGPKIAQVILEEAQGSLIGESEKMRPGQMRVILAKREAKPGRALKKTEKVEVVWTVDAGSEDREVWQKYGAKELRKIRIERLTVEALEQGGVATQEDLEQILNVSVRTIKRDIKEMEAGGKYIATRGNLHGVGRGQTHKGQIIEQWLKGKTYDQISRQSHHTVTAIKRYIQAFVRVIELHQQKFGESEIGLLLQIGEALVAEYLAVYEQNRNPESMERLKEQIKRLKGHRKAKKGVL